MRPLPSQYFFTFEEVSSAVFLSDWILDWDLNYSLTFLNGGFPVINRRIYTTTSRAWGSTASFVTSRFTRVHVGKTFAGLIS
jgi:hypothetical protein